MAVFISYSHVDFAIALRLRGTLNRAGIEIFWDQTGLNPGELLFQKIQSRMSDTDCVIALLTEASLKSSWVHTELGLARSLGIKLLPLLIGIPPPAIPDNLRYTDETIPQKIRDKVNLNYLVFSGNPTPVEFGQVAKSVYSLLPSICRGSLWPQPPHEFLHLMPSLVPGARGILFFGSLGDAVRTYGFGRCAVICPTSLDGNLGGPTTAGLLQQYPEAIVSPTKVMPDRPAVIGSYGNIYFVAATVFNPAFKPCSRDQRAAAAAILALSQQEEFSVVCVPLLGTGPQYSYPRFQAYKSFLAGTLSYYGVHRSEPALPWIVLVVPNTNKGLYLGYNVNVTDQRITQLCRDQLNLCYDGQSALCSYGDTLRTFLRNCGKYNHTLESRSLGVALGRGLECLERWPDSDARKTSFAYTLTTKIGDTICADGDTLVIL